MMRPSGRPPTPSARSIASEPVESVSTFILALLPRRMIEPSPNCLVIEDSASSMFLSRAWGAGAGAAGFVSAALGGGALDMADREAPVDALISNRRDSKIPNPPSFWIRPEQPQCDASAPGQLAQDRHGRPACRPAVPRPVEGPLEPDDPAAARAAAPRRPPRPIGDRVADGPFGEARVPERALPGQQPCEADDANCRPG